MPTDLSAAAAPERICRPRIKKLSPTYSVFSAEAGEIELDGKELPETYVDLVRDRRIPNEPTPLL